MAIIKEKGTLAVKCDVQTGVSAAGNNWARQTIVVDVEGYNGTYRKLALQASGPQVSEISKLNVGGKVEVSYQVTAREYQGKWYNSVDLFKIESLETAPVSTPQIPENTPTEPQTGDLPF